MSFFKDVFQGVENILQNSISASSPIVVNKGATVDVIPGDIKIIDITLSSEDHQRKTSLINQCTSIDIFESINTPAIFCELTVADSVELQEQFPIIKEELITISFETPNNPGNPTKYVFHVRSINNNTVNENQKMASYTITGVSPELLINKNAFVDKDYNDTISNIVKNIMEEKITTKKKVEVEKTVGIFPEKNIFNMLPFQAIHSMIRQAVSDRYLSHTFTFFENKHGFHFTTYERLIEQGRKQLSNGLSDKEFFYDMVRKEHIEDVNIRNIIAYNSIGGTDVLEKTASYINTATTIDMQSAAQKQAVYVKNIGADKFQKMDDNGAATNSTSNVRAFGKTKRPTAFTLLPIFSHNNKLSLAEAAAAQEAFVEELTNTVTQIHIYGDSDLTVGDMIKCNLPSASSFDDAAGTSRLDSGNYLITRLRHIILMGDRPQHTISLEMVKLNFTETA